MNDQQSLQPDLREVLLALLRRRRTILGVWTAILVSTAVLAFILPPEYRAAAKVLFTTDRAQISTSAERPTELVRTGDVSASVLNSQLQILRSRELVEEVVMGLGVRPAKTEVAEPSGLLATIAGLPRRLVREPYRRLHGLDGVEGTDPLYWEVREILQRVDAGLVSSSNIIEVGFTSPDPVFARNLVNALTGAYVEHHAGLQRIGAAEDFFTSQSKLLQQKLAASERELKGLREQAGALSGRQAEVEARLGEFSGELSRTKIERAELEQRVVFLERVKAGAGGSGRVATPELLALEARRAELIGRYRPRSARIRDIDEQIRRLRSAIASYDTIGGGRDDLDGRGDLMSARTALAALRGREQALEGEQEKHRREAALLEAQSFDLDRLERQVKLDEEAYLSYVRTAEQSRLSNAIEQSKLLRLTVIEQATLPVEPVSPRKGRMMMFGLIGGLLVAVGIAFAQDLMDTTVKTAGDVRRYGNLEVLAALPERT